MLHWRFWWACMLNAQMQNDGRWKVCASGWRCMDDVLLKSWHACYSHGQSKPGFIARNEIDTHADTCCAGSNWSVLEYTGQVCEVTPFLNSYEPIPKIPIAWCCTVWTNPNYSAEYLLVGNEMLWFGTLLPHSRINPNQLRAYGLTVNDDPFDHTQNFGINLEQTFIPFDTMGTVVHFESRVLTEWEKTHLPTILIMGEDWNPMEEVLRPNVLSQEDIEMRNLKTLSSRQVNSMIGTV